MDDAERTSIFSYFESRRASTHSNKSRLTIRSRKHNNVRSLKKKGHAQLESRLINPKLMKTKESDIKEHNDWADDIIDMFTVPTRKFHLLDDQGLVSNEESLERIITLLLMTSSLLILTASTLLVHSIWKSSKNWSEKSSWIDPMLGWAILLRKGCVSFCLQTNHVLNNHV